MSFPSEPKKITNRWIGRVLAVFVSWCISRQILPDLGDFDVNETPKGILIRLSRRVSEAIARFTSHSLSLADATESGQAKVRVYLGNTAGRKADSSMADDDDPEFKVPLTANGVRYIYAKITYAYSTTTGIWSSSASDIEEASAVPANDATHQYFEIGHAERITAGTGNKVKVGSIHQEVSGSQGSARTGGAWASNPVDYNWLQ